MDGYGPGVSSPESLKPGISAGADGADGAGFAAGADGAAGGQDRQTTHQDVARNLAAFAVAQVVVRIAGLGVVVVVARMLTSADFGRYSVALALSSLFTVFVESGMGGYLVREGTQSPHRVSIALGHVITLQTVTGVGAVGACAVVAAILGYDRATFVATVLMASGAVVMIVQRSLLAILQALRRSQDYALFQSGQALVTAAATVVAAATGLGPAGIAAAILLSAVASGPVAMWLLRR